MIFLLLLSLSCQPAPPSTHSPSPQENQTSRDSESQINLKATPLNPYQQPIATYKSPAQSSWLDYVPSFLVVGASLFGTYLFFKTKKHPELYESTGRNPSMNGGNRFDSPHSIPPEFTHHHYLHQDYYKILGVSTNVLPDELLRTYKELARKYHHNSNPANAAAEAKFKVISEAYETLSDPEKRSIYDSYKQRQK